MVGRHRERFSTFLYVYNNQKRNILSAQDGVAHTLALILILERQMAGDRVVGSRSKINLLRE